MDHAEHVGLRMYQRYRILNIRIAADGVAVCNTPKTQKKEYGYDGKYFKRYGIIDTDSFRCCAG